MKERDSAPTMQIQGRIIGGFFVGFFGENGEFGRDSCCEKTTVAMRPKMKTKAGFEEGVIMTRLKLRVIVVAHAESSCSICVREISPEAMPKTDQ